MATISDLIKSHISSGRLFHAYIITGSDEEGRFEGAKVLAQGCVCEGEGRPCGVCRACRKAMKGLHPDISVTGKVGDDKEIKIDAMRAVRSQAMVMPNEAEKSVFIIREADYMNAAAQNAMLKVFEEPPSHAVFILTAENPEKLLGTVRSRCELITLPPRALVIESALADKFWRAASKRDRVLLAAAATELEKEKDRAALADFIAALKRGAVEKIRSGEISEALFESVTGACNDAEKYMIFNMSAVHLAGLFLNAFLAHV